MSRPLAHLASLFVAPDARAPGPAGPSAARKPPRRRAMPPRSSPAAGVEWAPPVSGACAAEADPGAAPGAAHPSGEPPWPAVGRPRPRHAAVVGVGSDAVAVGWALAGELRARGRGRTALVLVWTPSPEPPVPAPARPAARRLAAALAGSCIVAARGHIVAVGLPRDPEAAVGAATRLGRDTDVPTVLVVAGPRPMAFDALLAAQDALVVLESVGSAGCLAALATAELGRLNARVVLDAPIGGARRLRALAGLGRARRLGARIDEARS